MPALSVSMSLSSHTLSVSHNDDVLENQLPMFESSEHHADTDAEPLVAEYKPAYTFQLSLFGNASAEREQNSHTYSQLSSLPRPTMKERKRVSRPSAEVYSANEHPQDDHTSATNDADSLDETILAPDGIPAVEIPLDESDALALQAINEAELPDDILAELQGLSAELPEELREHLFNPPAPPVESASPTKQGKPLSRRTLLRRIATEIGVSTWFDEDSEGWMWEDEMSGKTAFTPLRNEEKALDEALTEVIQNTYPYLSDADVEMILADPDNHKTIIQKAKAESMVKKSS